MRSFWTDPYLWVHLAGLAALPIFLEVCLVGLAIGDPVLPIWLELPLVAIVGIAPILWMQWQKPFCIFSLVALALKPDQLTVEQRKLLRLFKTTEVRILSVGAAVLLAVVLWQLYRLAPIASDAVPFASGWRLTGLLIAAIGFLASNLFLQVPVSVLRVLIASDAQFAATDPYPVEKISRDFTLLGLKVKRILPPLEADTTPSAIATSPAMSPVSSPTVAPQPEPRAEENPVAEIPPDVASALEDSSVADEWDESDAWASEVEPAETAASDPVQADLETNSDQPAPLDSENPTA